MIGRENLLSKRKDDGMHSKMADECERIWNTREDVVGRVDAFIRLCAA